jgi:hypothetical protein
VSEDLEKRVHRLEHQVLSIQQDAVKQTSKKRRVTKYIFVDLLPAILPSIAVAILGYLLYQSRQLDIESKKLDIEVRRLATTNIKEMRGLIQELYNPRIKREDAIAKARELGAFGQFAVIPLINVMKLDSAALRTAAEEGLMAASLSDRNYTCRVLAEVLNNRTRHFNWLTHERIIRILGAIGAGNNEAVKALQNYQALLDKGLKEYKRVVDASPENSEMMKNLEKALQNANARLDAS